MIYQVNIQIKNVFLIVHKNVYRFAFYVVLGASCVFAIFHVDPNIITDPFYIKIFEIRLNQIKFSLNKKICCLFYYFRFNKLSTVIVNYICIQVQTFKNAQSTLQTAISYQILFYILVNIVFLIYYVVWTESKR